MRSARRPRLQFASMHACPCVFQSRAMVACGLQFASMHAYVFSSHGLNGGMWLAIESPWSQFTSECWRC
eukprot:SAG25_NODE_5_length_29351_cov_43.404335_13_plen_69_part_00